MCNYFSSFELPILFKAVLRDLVDADSDVDLIVARHCVVLVVTGAVDILNVGLDSPIVVVR